MQHPVSWRAAVFVSRVLGIYLGLLGPQGIVFSLGFAGLKYSKEAGDELM